MLRNFLVATVIIVLGATVPVLAIRPGDRPSFDVDEESSTIATTGTTLVDISGNCDEAVHIDDPECTSSSPTTDGRPHGNDDPGDRSDDSDDDD